jgi:hypothetical protein
VEEANGIPASKYSGDGSKLSPLQKTMLGMLGDTYLPRLQLAVMHDSTFQEPFWNSVTGVISGTITPEEAIRNMDNWSATR